MQVGYSILKKNIFNGARISISSDEIMPDIDLKTLPGSRLSLKTFLFSLGDINFSNYETIGWKSFSVISFSSGDFCHTART